MDIWEKLYEAAKPLYNPHEVSDFVYANHVVAAIEAEDGQIFTGFCMESACGVFHLCAERAALFNMYQLSRQTKVKKILAFRDQSPHGGSTGMPCGACREFILELNQENKDTEFMLDYANAKPLRLVSLCLSGGERSVPLIGKKNRKGQFCWLFSIILYLGKLQILIARQKSSLDHLSFKHFFG